MIVSFHPCFEADVHVVLGSRPLSEEDRRLFGKARAIILPQGCPQELWETCAAAGAPVFPSYEARFRHPGKRGQSLLFERYSLPHPVTRRWDTVSQFRVAIRQGRSQPHPYPFMMKQDREHEGRGVYFVADPDSMDKALAALAQKERSGFSGFVTQEYVPTGTEVLRVVVVGETLVDYWKRPSRPGERITTVGRGARIDHEGMPQLREKGRALASLLAQETGINLAAVDIVFAPAENGSEPRPLLLEINYYFGRRGLGGTQAYYRLLHDEVRAWIHKLGLNPRNVRLV